MAKTKIPFTPEQIAQMRRMYLEEGVSLGKIAEHFGCSIVVIRNRLDNSVPISPPVKQEPTPLPVIIMDDSVWNPDREKLEEAKTARRKRRIVGVNI